jgi:hypothetical protein
MAKRSIHEASSVQRRSHGYIADAAEPKLDQGGSHLTAGQIYLEFGAIGRVGPSRLGWPL